MDIESGSCHCQLPSGHSFGYVFDYSRKYIRRLHGVFQFSLTPFLVQSRTGFADGTDHHAPNKQHRSSTLFAFTSYYYFKCETCVHANSRFPPPFHWITGSPHFAALARERGISRRSCGRDTLSNVTKSALTTSKFDPKTCRRTCVYRSDFRVIQHGNVPMGYLTESCIKVNKLRHQGK